MGSNYGSEIRKERANPTTNHKVHVDIPWKYNVYVKPMFLPSFLYIFRQKKHEHYYFFIHVIKQIV